MVSEIIGALVALVVVGFAGACIVIEHMDRRGQRREIQARARLRADAAERVPVPEREEPVATPAVIEPTAVQKLAEVVIFCEDCDTDSHKCRGCAEPTAHGRVSCGDC